MNNPLAPVLDELVALRALEQRIAKLERRFDRLERRYLDSHEPEDRSTAPISKEFRE